MRCTRSPTISRRTAQSDALVHNAGVWVRGNTPRTTADGLETTFAVNVFAPQLLTSLLAAELQGRLLWLGSAARTSADLTPPPWAGRSSRAERIRTARPVTSVRPVREDQLTIPHGPRSAGRDQANRCTRPAGPAGLALVGPP
jgi:NAD(P)-dependent dehydrogenase (short-subunit alcohol dehydrogenase family)